MGPGGRAAGGPSRLWLPACPPAGTWGRKEHEGPLHALLVPRARGRDP